MFKDRICPHCHEEFKQIDGKIFANHVRWCGKNPKHDKICGQEYKNKLRLMIKNHTIQKNGNKKCFKVECCNCHKQFDVLEYENKFPYKEHYFCSKFCARSYSGKHADPQNISNGIKHYNQNCCNHKQNQTCCNHKQIILEHRDCEWCKKTFEVNVKSKKKYCSNSCASSAREFKKYKNKLNACQTDKDRIKLELKKYRQECSFTFSLNDYPNEFDFSLIEKYGWYKAKNRGNNLNGVSRDHMYSVKDGFLNHIDPKILSHPANCRLLRHNENASKKDKSCITLEELQQRILEWDKKYNKSK